MNRLTMLDKLSSLWKTSISAPVTIILIIFVIGIIYITSNTNKKKIQQTKKIYIVLYTIAILILLGTSFNSISDIIENFNKNLFIVIYFPSLAVYSLAIIITNVIFLKTVFDTKINKIIKKINITVFIVIMYIFSLLVHIINKEELNVFKQESIYSNQNAHALIELTSIIFITWIMFIIIYKIYKKDNKGQIKKVIVTKEIPVEKVIEKIVYVEKPNTNKKVEVLEPYETDKNFNKNTDDFTLQEYKTMLQILKNSNKKAKKTKKSKNI